MSEYFLINEWSDGKWWSGIISLNNYREKEFPNRVQRQSWCSGNISALYAIYKSSQLLNNSSIEKKIFYELQSIINLSINDYGLYSPIICHGYAGLLTIIRNMYDETINKNIYASMIRLLSELLGCFNERDKYCFENRNFPNSKVKVLKNDNTFLNGAAGVIIELVSWLKVNNSFEKLLLIK